MKLSNQYRGLETEELQFLAEKARERKAAEKLVEQAENDEVREYREWAKLLTVDFKTADHVADCCDRKLAAKNAAAIAAGPQPIASSSTTPSSATTNRKLPVKAVKKDVKSLLKGVVVKKKPKVAEGGQPPKLGAALPGQEKVEKKTESSIGEANEEEEGKSGDKRTAEDNSEGAKRRKVDS